ncbi:hypothetical protein [Streptomyces sp. MJP52]|uniref:hypothetical protein n=1 Tax=Streptomyces sp. MJP52 TaxID=2940555 RepID=UPI002476E22E|nr:hypothetical protein [Streptomyces sp. MJP52]MDH6223650.1 hypothetical protein [Streptomyces sp. MJP52]
MTSTNPHPHGQMTYGLLFDVTDDVSRDHDDRLPPLSEHLVRVADSKDTFVGHPVEPDLRRVNAREAARHILACTDLAHVHYDDPLQALALLDPLPRDNRLRLLRAATERSWMPYPTARPRPRAVSGCPCPCTSGDFCGGCGHAGCGGR